MKYHTVLDQPFTDSNFSSAPYDPGFELDHFQKHAINCIKNNHNVLVTAHTGSGKTVPALFAIHDSLEKNRKIIYTSPIKSLSNQKFFELSQIFPDVGILTGDIKYKPDAQCVIMTTEILRNILYEKTSAHVDIAEVDKIIFDEVHYINDPDRGKVWEECFILSPADITLVMLSATIDKAHEFAQWIGEIKSKMTALIPTSHRVVPLEHFYWTPDCNSQLTKIVSSNSEYQNYNIIKQNYKVNSTSKMVNPVIDYLNTREQLPALFFVFSRKECERLAKSVQRTLVTSEEISSIINIFDYELRNHSKTYINSPQFYEIKSIIQKGIAYHHSGLIPVLKEVIEILFAKGLIKVLFATETFAVGVNMPTKTVIFPKLTKYSNGDFRYLRTDEYLQMAGRAGRRGLDKYGTIIILPSDELPENNALRNMMTGKSPCIKSKFRLSYQFILKILSSVQNTESQLNINSFIKQSYLTKNDTQQIESLNRQCVENKEKIVCKLSEESQQIISKYIQSEKSLSNLRGNAYGKAKNKLMKTQKEIKNFKQLYNEYSNYLTSLEYVDKLEGAVKHLNEYMEVDTTKMIKYLEDNEYVSSQKVVLKKGIMASEISECNEIVLTEVINSGMLSKLEQCEIIGLLAVFIEEKSNEVSFSSLKSVLSKTLVDALDHVNFICNDFSEYEYNSNINVETDWNLYLSFIEPAYRWAKGESIIDIMKSCDGIYEGTFIRNMLRINNILDNIKKIVEVTQMTSELKILENIETLILRDVVTTDSLYINKV